MRLHCLLLALAFAPTLTPAQVCSDFSGPDGPFPYGAHGTYQHATGAHGFANVTSGSCEYDGTTGPNHDYGPCKVVATANSSSGESDSGKLNVLGVHEGNYTDAQGLSTSNGGLATADAEGAAAFVHCSSIIGCSISIGITGSGTGGGFNVTFNPSPLWSDKFHYVNTCVAEVGLCSPVGNPPAQAPPLGCSWAWNSQTCVWYASCTRTSPLIVDTTGAGFRLSDPKTHCILFDLAGNGDLECLSWPEPGSGNAWLVYDRDGDGKVDSGQELFGNFTPHSDGGIAGNKYSNGFLALAWYDQPAQGGNLDLILDQRDKIWPKLRLWIDEHCYKTPDKPCSALPGELYTLSDKGIRSISLVYTSSKRKIDDYSNVFKYSAVVNPIVEDEPKTKNGESCCDNHQASHDGRLIYDVYLQTSESAQH